MHLEFGFSRYIALERNGIIIPGALRYLCKGMCRSLVHPSCMKAVIGQSKHSCPSCPSVVVGHPGFFSLYRLRCKGVPGALRYLCKGMCRSLVHPSCMKAVIGQSKHSCPSCPSVVVGHPGFFSLYRSSQCCRAGQSSIDKQKFPNLKIFS